MATVYPKTSLSIKGVDTNDNSKTFSVGYVNPENEDGTLKLFAEKIIDLTNLDLRNIYKNTQDDITSVSTDTSTFSFTLESTSNFLSTNDTTWTSYLTGISNYTNSQITYGAKNHSEDNFSSPLYLSFFALDVGNKIKNAAQYIKIVESRLLSNTGTSPIFKITQNKSGVWTFTTSGNSSGVEFTMTSSNEATKTIIQNIYDNIIQPTSGTQWKILDVGSNIQLAYQS